MAEDGDTSPLLPCTVRLDVSEVINVGSASGTHVVVSAKVGEFVASTAPALIRAGKGVWISERGYGSITIRYHGTVREAVEMLVTVYSTDLDGGSKQVMGAFGLPLDGFIGKNSSLPADSWRCTSGPHVEHGIAVYGLLSSKVFGTRTASRGDAPRTPVSRSRRPSVITHGAPAPGELHRAAWQGEVSVMSDLLRSGADVNGIERTALGFTPLHEAARAGNVPAASLLIRSGADVTRKDAHGDTPLHIACRRSHSNIVRKLLAAEGGALSVYTENLKSRRPVDVATKSGVVDLVRTFMQSNPPPLLDKRFHRPGAMDIRGSMVVEPGDISVGRKTLKSVDEVHMEDFLTFASDLSEEREESLGGPAFDEADLEPSQGLSTHKGLMLASSREPPAGSVVALLGPRPKRVSPAMAAGFKPNRVPIYGRTGTVRHAAIAEHGHGYGQGSLHLSMRRTLSKPLRGTFSRSPSVFPALDGPGSTAMLGQDSIGSYSSLHGSVRGGSIRGGSVALSPISAGGSPSRSRKSPPRKATKPPSSPMRAVA